MERRAGLPGWGYCVDKGPEVGMHRACVWAAWPVGTGWGRSSVLPGEVSGGAAESGLESQRSLSDPVVLMHHLPSLWLSFPIGGLLTT